MTPSLCHALLQAEGQPELDPLEFYAYLMPKLRQLNMDPSFLSRNVNEGFSGGEKVCAHDMRRMYYSMQPTVSTRL